LAALELGVKLAKATRECFLEEQGFEVAMTRVLVLVIAVLAGGCGPVCARTFAGYECPDGDCSDHAVGFRWAQQNEITDTTDCPSAKSASFQEGCRAYVDDPDRAADVDDEGKPIQLTEKT
jgi:hypothetical protein